jgi:hypothetical protein
MRFCNGDSEKCNAEETDVIKMVYKGRSLRVHRNTRTFVKYLESHVKCGDTVGWSTIQRDTTLNMRISSAVGRDNRDYFRAALGIVGWEYNAIIGFGVQILNAHTCEDKVYARANKLARACDRLRGTMGVIRGMPFELKKSTDTRFTELDMRGAEIRDDIETVKRRIYTS